MKLQFVAFILLAACANGHCRSQGKNADQPEAAAAGAPAAPPTTATAALPSGNANTKVRVYKADGSKQCAQNKGTDLKVMEIQLTKSGIKVLSSSKQPDGMMHTQVCGAATGTANTYEINSSDLKKAEKLGFRRLEN